MAKISPLDWSAIVLAFASAALWLLSALAVKIPTIPGTMRGLDDIQKLTDALQQQTKWNGWAALFTALAVVASAIAKLIG
jgi:hypothetical protein